MPRTHISDTAPGLIYSVIAPLILLFSSITFGLLWVVYRYNLLYVTISRPNARGLLYPIALNQLFTGVYVMELCMIGLFFLVRDDHNRATCVGQAAIMIIAIMMTLGFQFLLNDAFAPLLRFMPHSEMREEQTAKCHGSKTTNHLQTNTASTKDLDGIFANMFHELQDSSADKSDALLSLAFQRGSLRVQRPVVWIPDDRLVISSDEISRVKQLYSNVRISNEYAGLDEKGRLTLTQDTSRFSDIESMKL